jgi:hypothetical protein
VTLPVGIAPSDLALVDVDGDGLKDVVVSDQASGDVTVLSNDASHSFRHAARFRSGAGLYGIDTSSGSSAVASFAQSLSLAAGYFTGQGRNDLVVVNRGSHSFSVLANDGPGGFANPRPDLTTSTSDGAVINDQPGPLVAGRFRGDTSPLDLAVLMEDRGEVWVYNNDGSGHFHHASSVPAGTRPTGLSLVRNPGTGQLDLLVGNPFGDVLRLEGSGDGTFLPPPPFTGDRTTLSILNAGGKPSVLVANQQDSRVTVQTTTAHGGRYAPVTTLVSGATPAFDAPGGVRWMKLDGPGDRFYDAVVLGTGSNSVVVYHATGPDTFSPPVSFAVGTSPVAVTVADLNGDQVPDLLVSDRGSNDVAFLFGGLTAQGVWTATPGPRLKTGGIGPIGTTLRDVNGDGIPDLIVTNSQSAPNSPTGNLAVLPGRGRGFFDDRSPLSGTLPGTPTQPPVFAGGLGSLPTQEGFVAGFDPSSLTSFVAFASPEPAAALGALPDGELVAALEGGAVELLRGDPSGLLEARGALIPETGIPSEPSALEVLATGSGLQVLVTGAGLDTLFVFDLPSARGVTLPEPPPNRVAPSASAVDNSSLLVVVTLLAEGLPEGARAEEVAAEVAAAAPGAAAGGFRPQFLVGGADQEEDAEPAARAGEVGPARTGPDIDGLLRELRLFRSTEERGGPGAAAPGAPENDGQAGLDARAKDVALWGAFRPRREGGRAALTQAEEPVEEGGAAHQAAFVRSGQWRLLEPESPANHPGPDEEWHLRGRADGQPGREGVWQEIEGWMKLWPAALGLVMHGWPREDELEITERRPAPRGRRAIGAGE